MPALAISVLPVPVGTVTSTLVPAKMRVDRLLLHGIGLEARPDRNFS